MMKSEWGSALGCETTRRARENPYDGRRVGGAPYVAEVMLRKAQKKARVENISTLAGWLALEA
jgi:hypothetical protein